MKFNLLDKIEHVSADRLVGVKHVTLAEEYLADHFPTFPVLPGVMMVEAIAQAAGWLLHHRSDFGCSMAVLREARNVKYGHFVAPGNFLRVDVELLKQSETGALFKGTGTVGEAQAVSGRFEMAYFNLGQKQGELEAVDRRIIEHTRARWRLLRPGQQGAALPAG